MTHPYRHAPLPTDAATKVNFERLDRYVADLRRALVTGAFEGSRRSVVATLAADLEDLHARMSRQVAGSSAFCGVVAAGLFAVATWTRTLGGWWGFGMTAALTIFAVVVGLVGVVFVSNREVLNRAKDAASDLAKFAMTLPVDEIPTGVRVAADGMLSGTAAEEVASSSGERKEGTR